MILIMVLLVWSYVPQYSSMILYQIKARIMEIQKKAACESAANHINPPGHMGGFRFVMGVPPFSSSIYRWDFIILDGLYMENPIYKWMMKMGVPPWQNGNLHDLNSLETQAGSFWTFL